jgi:general secretion pathway protein D
MAPDITYRKQTMRKTYDINGYKNRILFASLCCFMCILCINTAGCNSESKAQDISEDAASSEQIIIEPNATVFTTTQLKQLNNIDVAPEDELDDSTAVSQEKPVDNHTTIPDPSDDNKSPGNTSIDEKPEVAQSSAATQSNQSSSDFSVYIPVLEEPGMADKLIAVNFEQVDIRTMLKTIGDITGINFVIDDKVSGKVTVMSPTKIRLDNLYNVLQSVLEVKGYAAIPSGKLVKIVSRSEAAKRNLEVRVGADPNNIPLGDFFVTQIVPIKYADAADIAQIIRPRLAKDAQITPYRRTNSILITDTSSNIYHIVKIIRKLDVTGSQERTTIIELEFASAQILSEQIKQILEKTKTLPRTPAPIGNTYSVGNSIKILPDERTNSLLVVADAKDTDIVKDLVKQLDIPRTRGTDNIHVVYLKNAEAKQAAQSLTAALGNLSITGAIEARNRIQITADEGTNALIISASKQEFEVISSVIEKLDIDRQQVEIEMLVVEVSEDDLTEIGIDWATLDQAVANSTRFFGATNFGPRVDFASGDLEGLGVGAWRLNGGDVTIGAILHALQKTSGVNILFTPQVTTSNHQKAKILVADNRPFLDQTRITETDPSTPTAIKSFVYKDVGILMELIPHIGQNGRIRLDTNMEFSKVVETVISADIDAPTTARRQVQTVVSMNSGSTIAIGGLIRDDKITIVKKIPLIGDIPLLGNLFRFKRDQLQKTNLIIFITPRILPDEPAMVKMTEEKKQKMAPILKELDKNVSRN